MMHVVRIKAIEIKSDIVFLHNICIVIKISCIETLGTWKVDKQTYTYAKLVCSHVIATTVMCMSQCMVRLSKAGYIPRCLDM